jgi:TetR/AcrR family transcriptional regulator
VPGAERRRQILEVAAKLFSARGYAGTTTKQIARGAGISETVLFRHFVTKEKLYAAILEHWVPDDQVETWLNHLRQIADRRDDLALFTAVVDGVLLSYQYDATLLSHRLVLYAALEDHELARIFQLKYTAPVGAFLREYVSRRQSEGAFRPMRPEIVVHSLLAVPAYYAQWASMGVNPFALTEQGIRTHAHMLLAGIRATP